MLPYYFQWCCTTRYETAIVTPPGTCASPVDEEDTHGAEGHTGEFCPSDGFVVEEKAHKDKKNGQKDALYYISCIETPANAVYIEVSHFQPHHGQPQYEGRPTKVCIFAHKVTHVAVGEKIDVYKRQVFIPAIFMCWTDGGWATYIQTV